MEPLRFSYQAVSKSGRGVLSLFSRPPKAAELMDRASRLLRRKLPGRCTTAAGASGAAGATGKGGASPSSTTISIELHPWAAPVKITAPADGELSITITATALGAGYVRYVVELMESVLEELDLMWPPGSDAYPTTRDAAALGRLCAAWLIGQLQAILDGREASKQLGIPQEPRLEVEGAAVLTPMGPRSRAWCEAVIAAGESGAAGLDYWPMGEAATAAALQWARGMWHLWVEVPWRLPMGESERGVMLDAHKALSAAYRADKALAMPWAEWAELVDILDEDDDLTPEIRQRGLDAEEPAQRLGYRRYPARFELTSGWSLRLSPNFADSWADGGAAMVGSDGERSVRCSCAESDGKTASEILAATPMQGDVLARLDEGPYRGRIEGFNDGINGVRMLTAIMATDGGAAVVSIVARYGDDDWAIQAWWSLRRRDVAWTAPLEAPASAQPALPPTDEGDPWRDAGQPQFDAKTLHEHWYGTGGAADPSMEPPTEEVLRNAGMPPTPSGGSGGDS